MSILDDAREGMDLSVRPQDDLFGHVNGRWLAETEIPSDRSSWGPFVALSDAAEQHVREIIEELAAGGATDAADPSAADEARKIGDLYTSFMDTERIAALGLTPVQPLVEAIGGLRDLRDLAAFLGESERIGGHGVFGSYVDNDDKDSERYLVNFVQGGLGLPDESYYREDKHAETREKYLAYLTRLLELGGTRTLVGPFDLDVYVTNLSGGAKSAEELLAEVNVRQPSFFEGLAGVLAEVPLEQWRPWLLVRVLRSAAPYLTDDLVETNFDFYGRTLNGTPELRARWKRGVALVEGALGEAVGKQYVARHFPPQSKAMMEQLVANLLAAYRESIAALDWMTADTKAKAYEKLETFNPKIGYPDTDRDEWHMLPQTVNAYYNPGTNEICFPAGILQPPFFSPDAHPAENYGGIGAVIGHEIGHGFDDQGAQFDPLGNLRDWWTPDDKAAFEEKSKKLVAQYDALEPRDLPGERVNGQLTVGENIGDLGGLTIAHKAYVISTDGQAGVEERRRLFLNWGHVWRTKRRAEQARQFLTIDPHSPAEFRANIVRNLDEFHEVFETAPGDGLWLDPEDRVRIW